MSSVDAVQDSVTLLWLVFATWIRVGVVGGLLLDGQAEVRKNALTWAERLPAASAASIAIR